jgi:hypothetical protein
VTGTNRLRMQCGNGEIECASDMKCEQDKIDSEDGHENETVRNRNSQCERALLQKNSEVRST